MKTGLLWFDDDPHTELEEKIRKAAARYEQKYGQPPNLCLVHPNAFDGRRPPCHAGTVEIRPRRSVLPHHFWLGMADGKGQGEARPQHSLVTRVHAAAQPMTPERARQLAMELELAEGSPDA